MKRSEVLCALVLVAAVPGAALAGLFPGALRSVGAGPDMAAAFTMVAAKTAAPTASPPPAAPKLPPVTRSIAPIAPPPVSTTQVTASGMVRRSNASASAVGGPTRVFPGQIGGASFTPKH